MTDTPMTPRHSPLTDTHREVLDRLRQCCTETAEYLRACKECGLDVDELLARNQRQLEIADQVRRTFFPDRP